LQDSSHMIAIPLIETRLVACATPSYLGQHGIPQRFSDLDDGKLILMSPLNRSEELKKFFHKENIRIDNESAHTCDDIEGVYQSVRANLGVGMLLNVSVEKELLDGTFVEVLTGSNLPKKRLHLVYKKCQWETQKHIAFKAHVKSLLSQEMKMIS